MIPTEWVLWGIILANVGVSYKGFQDSFFFRKYDFHVASILQGDRYRLFTSAFLHVDITHLFFNMLTLYFFAPTVIAYTGIVSFLVIYFGSLLSGNIFSLYFNKRTPYYRAVGASGAVTGIIYSAIMFRPDSNLYLFFALPIPAYLFGIGYLLYSIYGMKAQNDNIGHTAHFGGAVTGYLMTLLLYPVLLLMNTTMVVLLALPIVLLFYLIKTKKI